MLAGAAAVVLVQGTAAVTEARLRVPGEPVWRCWPVAALVLHDVAVGLAVLAPVALLAERWLPRAGGVGVLVMTGAVLVALAGAAALGRRRRGPAVLALVAPRDRVAEPVPPLRARLLTEIERSGVRGTTRWLVAEAARCRLRCGATADQLLPALWPAVRLRLREAPGVPRTEVALLLLQAQTVMDDASPADERMLTLLHLVHDRTGRSGVRAALEQARRSPVRHGRPVATWGAPAGVTPSGAGPLPADPTSDVAAEPVEVADDAAEPVPAAAG